MKTIVGAYLKPGDKIRVLEIYRDYVATAAALGVRDGDVVEVGGPPCGYCAGNSTLSSIHVYGTWIPMRCELVQPANSPYAGKSGRLYAEGASVEFTFDFRTWFPGKIRGFTLADDLWHWIVEGEISKIYSYPWSCIAVTEDRVRPKN